MNGIPRHAHINTRLVYGFSIYVAMIIGVGMFGLPYAGAQAGFPLLLLFFVIGGGIVWWINNLYSHVIMGTEGHHRLSGYAGIYLGRWWRRFSFIVEILATYGSLLAYLVVGGTFLARLFHGPEALFIFIYFVIGAFLIWQDARSVGPVDLLLMLIFLGIVVFLLMKGILLIEFSNLTTVISSNFFLPYGIVMFSLWAVWILPEINDDLGRDHRRLRQIIKWGILSSTLVYLVFSVLVIGLQGINTSPDALTGLDRHFGSSILTIGYVFGFIATFTSFISLGLNTKKLFMYDYRLSNSFAWLLTCFIPLILYIVGLHNFIQIISITGAVMLGLSGAIIAIMYLRVRRREDGRLRRRTQAVTGFLIALLLSGVVLEIVYSSGIL